MFQMQEFNPISLKSEYGSPTKNWPCRVCAPLGGNVPFHRHHSTQFMYNQLLRRKEDMVNCPTCKVRHNIHLGEKRRIIVLSTSTLHNTFLNPVCKSSFHFDLETVCGGRLQQLHKLWQHYYNKPGPPMDVVISAGLNDVARMLPDQFLSLAEKFRSDVMLNNTDNTFTMVGLMFPPKLTWFPYNASSPPQGHIDYREAFTTINEQLRILSVYPDNWVSFESEGCRSIKRRDPATGKKVSVTQHNLSATYWREYPHLDRALHLAEPKRAMLISRITRYLEFNMSPENITTLQRRAERRDKPPPQVMNINEMNNDSINNFFIQLEDPEYDYEFEF